MNIDATAQVVLTALALFGMFLAVKAVWDALGSLFNPKGRGKGQ